MFIFLALSTETLNHYRYRRDIGLSHGQYQINRYVLLSIHLVTIAGIHCDVVDLKRPHFYAKWRVSFEYYFLFFKLKHAWEYKLREFATLLGYIYSPTLIPKIKNLNLIKKFFVLFISS